MTALLARFWPHLAVALAVIGVLFWVDDRGYQRAKADQAALEQRISERVSDAVAEIDRRNAARFAEIDSADRTVIQPIITREIASDPRFSDPAAGITDGMRDALNRARALSSAPGADSRAVPGASDDR